MGQVEIGDLVILTPNAIKVGKQNAITGWKHINVPKGYINQVPEDSSLYKQWFEAISNSAAIVLEVINGENGYDQVWLRLRFMCFDEPFWMKRHYFRKCR